MRYLMLTIIYFDRWTANCTDNKDNLMNSKNVRSKMLFVVTSGQEFSLLSGSSLGRLHFDFIAGGIVERDTEELKIIF